MLVTFSVLINVQVWDIRGFNKNKFPMAATYSQMKMGRLLLLKRTVLSPWQGNRQAVLEDSSLNTDQAYAVGFPPHKAGENPERQ